MSDIKEKPVSPYTILNRWLYDGSKKTELPEELVNDKVIPNTILLYHFQSSVYGLYISELFNNFDIYQLDKVDVFKFLKQCISLSGYKPPFIERMKSEKTKISKAIKLKFPYMKMHEINMFVDIIDKSDQKDVVYETLGFYQPKKKKTTIADKKKLEQIQKPKATKSEPAISLENVMSNFV